VSVLGRAYLLVALTVLVLAVIWASVTLSAKENVGTWIEIVLLVPQLDLVEPFALRRYQVHAPALLAGWVVIIGGIAVFAVRAPFRIRRAALTARRLRELEREVHELRTLPLRQQEEDALLEAEAHLDGRSRRVFERRAGPREGLRERGAAASPPARAAAPPPVAREDEPPRRSRDDRSGQGGGEGGGEP
jgi:hypothetical protein